MPAPVGPQVLVKVRAAAITFDELLWDETWLRDGVDRTPIIPSHEWSGVVADAAESTGFRVGQPVFGMVPFDRNGAAAEYVAVPPDHIAPKPDSLTHVAAAAVPLAGLTAWQALVDHGRAQPGNRVLVLGAAGGVGSYAVQLALGLQTQVTATTLAKDREFVRGLGAAEVVATPRGSHGTELRHGAYDVVVDTVGGALTNEAIGFTRRGGTYVALQQPPPPEALAALGVDGAFFVVRPSRTALDRVRDSVEEHHLRVTVAATFPLSEGRAAYESGSLPGRSPGKTVLVVSHDEAGPAVDEGGQHR